jgi:predicted Zn-dependent peptidase
VGTVADYWVEAVLPNGLRALLHPLPRTRTTTWGVFVNHGIRDEDLTTNGISHFLEHVVFNAQYRSQSDVAALVAHGSAAEAFTTKEYTEYLLTTMPEDSLPALRGLGALVSSPVFDVEVVDRERPLIREELNRFRASPAVLNELLENALFGDLGLFTLGTAANVEAFTAEQLERRHAQFYTPHRTTVVGEGPLDVDYAMDAVESVMGQWRRPPAWTPFPVFEDAPRVIGIPSGGPRVSVRLGFRGPGLTSPERPAFALVADALGLGIGSRLSAALRDQEALAYDVQASTVQYGPIGYLKISLTCDRAVAPRALGRVLEVVGECHAGLEPQELDRVRSLRTTALLRQAGDSQRMLAMVGKFAVNGLTFLVDAEVHSYGATTPPHTATVAQQYLTGDACAIVALGLSTEELLTGL